MLPHILKILMGILTPSGGKIKISSGVSSSTSFEPLFCVDDMAKVFYDIRNVANLICILIYPNVFLTQYVLESYRNIRGPPVSTWRRIHIHGLCNSNSIALFTPGFQAVNWTVA